MAEPVVAIHQPNFLPWLGYFDKLARADFFVLLDDVQFPKKGGTWVNRVRMLTGGGEAGWATVPVDRSYHGVRAINEMRIDDSRPWRQKLLTTIRTSYAKSPAFAEVFPLAERLLENSGPELAVLNENAIRVIADSIGLKETKLVRSSELETTGHATDLLIEIVAALGGGVYLCGAGSEEYLEPPKFEQAGIDLRMQEFRHPGYAQRGDEFVEGLSVLDALMSCGFSGVRELLEAEA